ncbi:MAG TPA: oligosaccharide flippase family protein [Parasegetibacter sp.]
MGSIKKLAGETLWYGVPTIASRFLSYLLSILMVGIFQTSEFGVITTLYAAIPFLNIIFTYGLETSYFRYVQHYEKKHVYNTLQTSIIVTSLVFTGCLLFLTEPVSRLLEIEDHPEYIRWLAWIVLLDTLATLPLALLRQEGRPRKFAFVRVGSILANIALMLLFYVVAPSYQDNLLFFWYDPEMGVGYVLIANILASVIGLLLLWKELKQYRFSFDFELWKKVIKYALPLLVVGFGGMINEMLSRVIFLKVSPLPEQEKLHALGVFGANYKLAVLITIFIQVFRMAAEPFFFNQSKDKNAPRTYARVMKFFVIACCFMYLGVNLFLDVWKWLITWKYEAYGEGIYIVPVLTVGSVCLGIYYNLSIWYKLTGQNMIGAYITLGGAVLTILLNIWWIPLFSYTGSAWATLICYASMMIASYLLGKKYYPIPYAWKKLVAYLIITFLIYLLHRWLNGFFESIFFSLGSGIILVAVFALFVFRIERHDLPVKFGGKRRPGA